MLSRKVLRDSSKLLSQSRSYSYFSQRPPGSIFAAGRAGQNRSRQADKAPQRSTAKGRHGENSVAATTGSDKGRGEGTSKGKPDQSLQMTPHEAKHPAVRPGSVTHVDLGSSGLSSDPFDRQSSILHDDSAHPHPPLPAVHLHTFFSQHRPMLLLDQPLPALFQTHPNDQLSHILSASSTPLSGDELFSDQFAFDDLDSRLGKRNRQSDKDAEGDVARLLSRAMVLHRIEADSAWNQTLSSLGVPRDDADSELSASMEEVSLDSVKRKRRRKMNKHKYKKRRKLQRAERRRLGK